MEMRINISQTEIWKKPFLCYEFSNRSCQKFVYPLETRILLYILFSVSSVVTIIGNLLVIITVIHFKQLRTPTNYLILSLAVADLLVGGVVMPPSMLRSIETCWYLGDLFYRYYAICHPFQYHSKMTSLATLVMIIICWSVSAALGFGMIFMELNILGVEDFYYENIKCDGGCTLFQSKAGATIFSLICFYIPAFVMLCVYLKILHAAQRQVQAIQSVNSEFKKEGKATKTLAIVMGVFLTFWIPFFLCNLIDPFIGYSVPPLLFDLFYWVGYYNSTCNPIVYAVFYSWFRHAFRIILSKAIFQTNSSRTVLM
ncbi:trace amine-associated receptor 1-like [Sinocyclocheilus anshuiensis]|uniref:trace amine-associated receptor 1-like n=1 Tax=Sinocyclocheilus anshuiensis TaxID=1608454 RepID=UPI0007B84C4F|nr:PREDICTED: trace amine-associated receptor 1-like [Sinocyclocheilus anshuiensis]